MGVLDGKAAIVTGSARDPFYGAAGFASAYDWTEEIGHAAWEHVFDSPDGIARRLDEAVHATERAATARTRPFRSLRRTATPSWFRIQTQRAEALPARPE